MQHGDLWVLAVKAIEQGGGLVCAGVVDEEKVSGSACADPFDEGLRVETCLLVEAGNDQRERQVVHGVSSARETCQRGAGSVFDSTLSHWLPRAAVEDRYRAIAVTSTLVG